MLYSSATTWRVSISDGCVGLAALMNALAAAAPPVSNATVTIVKLRSLSSS
jgi:hypothetical protein